MPKVESDPNSAAIQKLLEKKFGDLLRWSVPPIEKTVGPYNPDAFDAFENRRVNLIGEARKFLMELSVEDLTILYVENSSDPEKKREVWASLLQSEKNSLMRREPSWLAGGFGHPDYAANFEYWGQMEKYTLHEALLLSVGVEPKHFGEDVLAKHIKQKKIVQAYPAIEFLVLRHEQFIRRFPSGMNGVMRVSPRFLADWFEEVMLSVHPKFLSEVKRRRQWQDPPIQPRDQGEPTKATLPRMDKREIDKIAQLFTAIAIRELGYSPSAKRSPIPKEIAEMCASMGLKICDDTVRKYLKLGARSIPEDWEPN